LDETPLSFVGRRVWFERAIDAPQPRAVIGGPESGSYSGTDGCA